jgi:hypothetical protein
MHPNRTPAAILLAWRNGRLVVGARGVPNRQPRPYAAVVKGKMPSGGEHPKQPRRKLSKAELREQAAAAFLAWRTGQTAKDK